MELTLKSVGRAGGWEVMRKVELVGSHLSVQTEMDVPFPTYQRYPCWTIFWAAIMLHQAYKGEEPRKAVRRVGSKEVTLRKIFGYEDSIH